MMKISLEGAATPAHESAFREYREQALSLYEGIFQGESTYQDHLGWLDPEEWAGQQALEAICRRAEMVRKQADAFVLIGVGGSNQAARALIKALDRQDGPEIFYSGNTLTPHSMNRLLQSLEKRSVHINVIAKNFETLEPGICFRILRTYLEQRYGALAAERITVTGTPGSQLHALAQENGYAFLTFPENIGGRYSALSDVGLFPMAVAGANISELVRGAAEMRNILSAPPTLENPAVFYTAHRSALAQAGKQLEMLSVFEPRLRYFGKWWVQLFAESEGKDGKGLFPVFSEYSEDLHSVGQFVQDGSPLLFETFLKVQDPGSDLAIAPSRIDDGFDYLNEKGFRHLNRVAELATIQAHTERFPCLCLSIPCINEYYLGQLFYFFEFSCYLSGRLMGINPFDQPGVEAYKQVMFKRLEKPGL